jgi:hypothetical protein
LREQALILRIYFLTGLAGGLEGYQLPGCNAQKVDIFIKASPGQPAAQIHSQVLEGRNLALFWSNDGFWLSYVPILVVVFHVLNTTKFLC